MKFDLNYKKTMNNNLENKLSRYQKVQGYLVLHSIKTAGISVVATLKNQFDTKITALLSLASSDINGFTVEKQAERINLKVKII
jgi:hypothetical protein